MTVVDSVEREYDMFPVLPTRYKMLNSLNSPAHRNLWARSYHHTTTPRACSAVGWCTITFSSAESDRYILCLSVQHRWKQIVNLYRACVFYTSHLSQCAESVAQWGNDIQWPEPLWPKYTFISTAKGYLQ